MIIQQFMMMNHQLFGIDKEIKLNTVIVSFFNSSNLGDCVLSNSLYKYYKDLGYNCDKVSYALNPFEFMDVNNIKEIKLKKNSGKKDKIINLLSNINLSSIIYKYYEYKEYLNVNDKIKFEKLVIDSDFVVIGGGNMVFDLTNKTLSSAKLNYFIELVHKKNKKVYINSIGIGPFYNNKQLKSCIKTLNKADVVTFRDKGSLDLYKKNSKIENYYLSSDPAFLLEDKNKKSLPSRENISINIIDPLNFTQDDKIINLIKYSYIDLIKKVSKMWPKVILFSTEVRDKQFIKEIYKKISLENVEYSDVKGIDDLMNIYTNTRILIGSRMHSIIIATTQKIPVIGINWQEKVKNLFDLMNKQENVFDIENIDPSKMCEIIEDINKRYIKEVEEVNTFVEKMKERFSINNRIVEEI